MSRETLKRALVPVETLAPTSIGEGDWIQLEYLLYKDNKGVKRRWERCVRKRTSSNLNVDAVDIHAVLLTPKPELLLVIQYRPAIQRYCIEFPSGLIDPNENDPISSAQRELKEETGYLLPKESFDLVRVPVAYEPGLTNSCCYVAKVTIDVSTLETPVVQELEADEWSLQVISLPLENLLDRLLELEKSQNGLLVIDSRVHALASGLALSKFTQTQTE